MLRFPASTTLRPLHLTHVFQGMTTDPCCLKLLFWAHVLPRAPSSLRLQVCEPFRIQDLQLVFGLMIFCLHGSFSQRQQTAVSKIDSDGPMESKTNYSASNSGTNHNIIRMNPVLRLECGETWFRLEKHFIMQKNGGDVPSPPFSKFSFIKAEIVLRRPLPLLDL